MEATVYKGQSRISEANFTKNEIYLWLIVSIEILWPCKQLRSYRAHQSPTNTVTGQD